MPLPEEFITLSREIGSQPLLVQGPGGNTSFKSGNTMWIKASGTELAEAGSPEIFVAVDRERALAELDGAGDGTCRAALIDPEGRLRPSIETTFHAMFEQAFVFHFHSVATICHAISVEGRHLLDKRLDGLAWTAAPYVKPGVPLSQAIRDAMGGRRMEVVVLENHGVIVAADTLPEIRRLIHEVETRLDLPAAAPGDLPASREFPGWQAVSACADLVHNPVMRARATAGTYYPDHVVFLGPALPLTDAESFARTQPEDWPVPVVLVENEGVYRKDQATPSQSAMLDCIYQVLRRIPDAWTLVPIGESAEAELLNWDAEKYRQRLVRSNG